MVSERETPRWDPTYVTSDAERDLAPRAELDPEIAGASAATLAEAATTAAAPLTTLRTALLSWTLEGAPGAEASSVATSQHASPITPSAARAMLESMSLPMLGGGAISGDDAAGSRTAPGMIADRAHGWSVAQERSAVGSLARLRDARARARGARLRPRSGRGSAGGAPRDRGSRAS